METTRQLYLKKSYSAKKTIKWFIHNWFASGKNNYGQPLVSSYCKQSDNSSMYHDHFLASSESTIKNEDRLILIENKLK